MISCGPVEDLSFEIANRPNDRNLAGGSHSTFDQRVHSDGKEPETVQQIRQFARKSVIILQLSMAHGKCHQRQVDKRARHSHHDLTDEAVSDHFLNLRRAGLGS